MSKNKNKKKRRSSLENNMVSLFLLNMYAYTGAYVPIGNSAHMKTHVPVHIHAPTPPHLRK